MVHVWSVFAVMIREVVMSLFSVEMKKEVVQVIIQPTQEVIDLKVDVSDYLDDGEEIVLLIFEDLSKFRFEKINIKYKINADRQRRIRLFQLSSHAELEDEFSQAEENDADGDFKI